MKMTVLGGGGVRAPLFVLSTLKRAQRIHLDELVLMDIDRRKLELIGAVCREVAAQVGSPVSITTTSDARAALEGARYIVTTIRVGGEQGRVLDERIALKHGVLGQETTGPGGFAMAMRSIPAILNYARLAEQVAPGAWIFNFTNPAGLVAQALRREGFDRTVGICDGANEAQAAVAGFLKIPQREVKAEVFGLNHLSWGRAAFVDGRDVLPELLHNPDFYATTNLAMFDRELVDMIGFYLNEYLYYYYYAERAVAQISGEERTRGEEILGLNRALLDRLEAIDIHRQPEQALRAYVAYERRRGATYMHYARPGALTPDEADEADIPSNFDFSSDEGEGYAGVALSIIEAFETGQPLRTALNVPNDGAIEGMEATDVVEVSC